MSEDVREDRSRKRRKVEDNPHSESTSITSLHQLRQLLHFSPATPPEEVASNINTFNSFLTSILAEPDSRQLKILKDYCDEQSSSSHDQLDFPDILSAWSNASQNDAEAVLSAVPAALTQFFRTISSNLDFRDFGLSLCHSLLKRDHVRILDRGLSSPRTKEHLITPCLQLLAEVASFDGGALASNVFNRRDFLYRRLEGILSQTPTNPVTNSGASAHQAALEFLLANLKYLDADSKSELITHGRLTYSALRSLPNIDAATVVKTLNSFGDFVLNDGSLSKQMRIRCFNSGVLSVLAKLYEYSGVDPTGPSTDVRDALQRLLLQTCTSSKGILLAQTGWYPSGGTPETLEQDGNMLDLGLDSPFHLDDYTEKVPVKNTTLSTFLQTLKPEHDVLQANLIKATFGACPELVADYFTKKQRFLVPPGDDPKWRGQFAFLFSTVQLPVPHFCGWHEKLPTSPPPLSIVIESIIPRPLDRATVGKCLRMEDDIMTISATRLLTVALEKLDEVLKVFEKGPANTSLWRQAASKITALFIDQVPLLHEIVTALQKVDQTNEHTRTTVFECIAVYMRVLPPLAASTKFDFGPSLSRALRDAKSDDVDAETIDILFEQIQHLLHIVNISPTTRWFHKADSDDLSLIAQLVSSSVQQPQVLVRQYAMPALKAVLYGKGILSSHTQALEALMSSLSPSKKWTPELVTYQFLDNCLTRTMQRPVKYLDQLEQAQQLLSDSTDLSLLVCCVAEQWQFVVKKEDKSAIKNLTVWIARLFSALDDAGENFRVMNHLKEDMLKQCENHDKAKVAFEKAFEKQRKKPVSRIEQEVDEPDKMDIDGLEMGTTVSQSQAHGIDLDSIFPSPPLIPKSLSGLDRWLKPDFESEIQSGRLANLVRCLLSPEDEIRLQAFQTLQGVMYSVEESDYDEKAQLYLLLGELSETMKAHTSVNTSSPPPSIVSELAIHLLPIIAEPSSPFYRKSNSFLLRGPSWSIAHILSYWINETFLIEPEVDDADIPFHIPRVGTGGNNNAQALEVDHFLDLLIRSLRTLDDMNLFRRAQLFPRLFSYYLSPVTSKAIRKKILALVYRATQVDGGSDTLITRMGVREWLSIAKTIRGHSGHGPMFGRLDDEVKGWIEAVEAELKRTCDERGIDKWQSERKMLGMPSKESTQQNGQAVQAEQKGAVLDKDKLNDNHDSSESDSSSETTSDSDSESSSASGSD